MSAAPWPGGPRSAERDAPASIDLNADVGELAGPYGVAVDAALLRIVTTAHIACGGHAGDEESMRRTVAAAVAAGTAVGAHPSYPDRQGVGRRPMDRTPPQVAADVTRQVEALRRIAAEEGATVRSVKAHGALYNRMAGDQDCAEAVVRAVQQLGGDLVLVVLAGSAVLQVATALGLAVAAEAFCDRGYLPDGTLAPRSSRGGLVTDPGTAARRARSLARDGRVEAVDGTVVSLSFATLCVHGDSPGAVATARAVRRALVASRVVLAPLAGSRSPVS